jgi:O-methyltransferase involved in polyketide biosynthesis
MTTKEKIELYKKIVVSQNDITDEDWEDASQEEGFEEFMNSVVTGMEMYFNRRAVELLRFVRTNYQPKAPNIKEWVDINRNVLVGEDGILIAFSLKKDEKNI